MKNKHEERAINTIFPLIDTIFIKIKPIFQVKHSKK